MNILIVDDEREIADLVEFYLKNEGYHVYKFYNGKSVIECCQHHIIDLAIIDIMLPDIDGFSLTKQMRKKYEFPIIMLTAKENEVDKIMGLTLGADDYVTKPFRPLELVARVKAQLRRYHSFSHHSNDNMISIGGLVIDKDNHQCLLNNKQIFLTPTEFDILWLLCQNKGKVVTADMIFESLWGEKYYSANSNSIMVHIRHIREKMDDADNPKYIKTIWGVGYKID